MDKDLLKIQELVKLERHKLFGIYSNYLSENIMPGLFKSIFAGKGVIPSDSVPYIIGEDLTRIDLSASLRSSGFYYKNKKLNLSKTVALNGLYIRNEEVEKENNLVIILDAGFSMLFRKERQRKTSTKIFNSLMLVDVFNHCGRKSNFTFKYYFFNNYVKSYPTIGFSKSGNVKELFTTQYIKELNLIKERIDKNFDLLFRRLLKDLKYRSTIILVSDFITSERNYEKAVEELAKKHLIIPIILYDSKEYYPNMEGFFIKGEDFNYSIKYSIRDKDNWSIKYYDSVSSLFRKKGINPIVMDLTDMLFPQDLIRKIEKYFIELARR